MPDLNKVKYQMLTFQMNLTSVQKIYEVFESENLSPVLIKGLAAAINYPQPFQRVFSDIDLAVEPSAFEKAQIIIRRNNFNIDLHKGLRHLDVLDWDKLFQNSLMTKINETGFRVLCPEDHLRVLCVHWLNDGGADRTRLWDIYFCIKKNFQIFDWERFFYSVDEKRREWLWIVLLAVREYVGSSLIESIPQYDSQILPEWIKKELEKEWGSDDRLTPLERVLSDKKALYKQIRRRFPPNILQAIVETESEIQVDALYFVRGRDFIKRAKSSIINSIKTND